jgi:hypothetical protein
MVLICTQHSDCPVVDEGCYSNRCSVDPDPDNVAVIAVLVTVAVVVFITMIYAYYHPLRDKEGREKKCFSVLLVLIFFPFYILANYNQTTVITVREGNNGNSRIYTDYP